MCLITELLPGFDVDTAINILLDSEATMNQDGISISDVYYETVTFGESVSDIIPLLNSEAHYIVHQRYATRGESVKELCHPFKIDNNLWLAHNGTLSDSYLKRWGITELKNHSDTSALSAALYKSAPLSGYNPEELMGRLLLNLGHNVLTLIGYGAVTHSEPLIQLTDNISVSNLYSLSTYFTNDYGKDDDDDDELEDTFYNDEYGNYSDWIWSDVGDVPLYYTGRK